MDTILKLDPLSVHYMYYSPCYITSVNMSPPNSFRTYHKTLFHKEMTKLLYSLSAI